MGSGWFSPDLLWSFRRATVKSSGPAELSPIVQQTAEVEAQSDTQGSQPNSFFRSQLKGIYHWLLTLPGGGKGVPRRLPTGEMAYVLPHCRSVDWSRAEYSAFLPHLRPGVTVLDIGANVGFNAILFGKQVAPSGKVFAFEPAPQSYEALRRHLTINGLAEVVEPVNAAVGDRPGQLQFLADGVQGSNHVASVAETKTGKVVSVPCLTIDEFCSTRGLHPAMLKIDTEGFELPVLRGARETIRKAGKDLAVFIELHPTFWQPVAGYCRAELEAELDSLGLALHSAPSGVDVWTEDTGLSVEFRPR